MHARISALVFGVGCNSLLGLDQVVPPIDAGPCRDPNLTTDEDNDQVIDGCDLCPADPEINAQDSDHDGVGDTCDPNPQTRGDKIVLFDSMTTDLGYTTTTQWQQVNGQYFTSVFEDSRATLAIDPTTDVSVDAIFSSIMTQGGVDGGAGVTLNVGAATIVDCVHIHNTSPIQDQLKIRVNGSTKVAKDLLVSTSIRFHLRQNADGSFDCTGAGPTSTETLHIAPLIETVVVSFGFVSIIARMTINSVTIFGKN